MRFLKSLSVGLLAAMITCQSVCLDSFAASAKTHEDAAVQVCIATPANANSSQKSPLRPDLNPSTGVHVSSPAAEKRTAPAAEKYLLEGKVSAGEDALIESLSKSNNDDQVRFGLAILQFMHSVEQLSQDLHRYGIRQLSMRELPGPLERLPIAPNTKPEKISYEKLRTVFQTLLANLEKTEATLGAIKDPNVKLPLHFGLIQLDIDGDGKLSEEETLWKEYNAVAGSTRANADNARDFLIVFDRGDVSWLRGYCNVLMSLCEMYLAHDSRQAFESTAHIFFPKVESPYGYLAHGKHVRKLGSDDVDVLDLVALIHLIHCDVTEPQRMASALHHLEQVVVLSRETWKYIMAETDDDREWLPNPNQKGVIPGVTVTPQMVTAWASIMDESEKLLKGKKLIPFWRAADERGINLRKVFLEPKTFDLVLWVQGSAAAPYLEFGEKTTGKSWREWRTQFGNNFPGFAAYFN